MNKLRPQREVYTEYINAAKHAIDLTAIFNSHGDQVDAAQSVEHVEPDSLVFIEGHCSTPSAQIGTNELARYNFLRMEYGTHSREYNSYKNTLIENAESDTYAPALSYLDFSQSAAKQRSLLVEKNCIVLTADYVNLEGAGPNINTTLAESSKHPFTGTTLSTGKRIRKLEKNVSKSFNVHKFREECAAELIAVQTAGIMHSHNTQALNHTRGNKLTSYIIYGTAHAHSLTHEIEEQNINLIQTKIIDPLPEHMYLDESDKAFDANFNRRVAHAAIKATTSALSSTPGISAIIDAAYPNLESLNNDKNSLLQLVIQLIQIHDRLEQGEDNSINEYVQLLISLSPNIADEISARQATEHDF